MDLIDRSKLHSVCVVDGIDSEGVITTRSFWAADVANAPTVEAIPIEWLKNELIPKAENLGATTYVDNIRFVLEDWEAWKKYRG